MTTRTGIATPRTLGRAAPPTAGFVPGFRVVLRGLLQVLMRWQARHEQRLALRRLTDAELADCGLSRAQVEAGAARPFRR